MSEADAKPGGGETPARERAGQAGEHGEPRLVRVLCVEDLHPVAEAICDAVDDAGGLKSVGVLSTPDGLLAEVRRRKPDVVLLDLYYGGRDAFKELKALRDAEPGVAVIVVSGDNHPATIRRAFEAGVRGYVVKSSVGEVIDAIRAVSGGKVWRPGETRAVRADVDGTIDAMIAALGDPVAAEGRRWVWQLGRLRVEARAEGETVLIDLPWPLRSVPEPPSFGDLHEEPDGEVKLRFAVATPAALELVLGVIAYEDREG